MVARNVMVLGVLAAVLAPAGQFKCGRLRTSEDVVVLSIPHPPDALLRAKNLRIVWESSGSFQKAEQVRNLIEQALAKEFGFTDPNPDATMTLSLLSFEPVAEKRYTQNESRPMKVGEKPTYDKNGKQTGTVDIIENRVVPVEYWEATGSLKINAGVLDKSRAAIDSFAATGSYKNKIELSVAGESKRGAGSVDSVGSIENNMMDRIAAQMRRRYTATFDPVRVMLACDNDLRPANKLAQAGQWKAALDGWKSTTLKKNGADQTFNIAVATEASAYAEYARTQNLEDMLPPFKTAMDLYEQALNADPQEKYMRQQRDRLKIAQTNIENVRKHYELQQAEAKKAEEAAAKVIEAQMGEQRRKADLQNAIKDKSPDSAEEAKFRPMARARVVAMEAEITPEQAQDLVGFGQRTFGLNELKSYRVVWQEVERKKALAQKLTDYDGMFKAFVADGKLTASERVQLKDLQKTMELEDSEAQAVESKYTFKDETKVAAATAPAQPKATTKKSATPPKPATVGRPPATKPATVGTPPAIRPASVLPKPGIGSDGKKQDEKK